jgi:hypothetical protein
VDDPDRHVHVRWLLAAFGLISLIILGPMGLDDATRDVNVRCVRVLGHGECTISMGWLLHSSEWDVNSIELLGGDMRCGDNGCSGTLELVGGDEELGLVDQDTFRDFINEIEYFASDPGASSLDVSLGPARSALMMLAVWLAVSLALMATFEYSLLHVDREHGVLYMKIRGLLHWADVEIPLGQITQVSVERLPVNRDNQEPQSIVWLQQTEGPPLRIGKSGESGAEALAGWLRERLRARV